jgi:hypothetical protein
MISGFRSDVDEIALFWDITRRRVVIVYRRFGTMHLSHLDPCRLEPIRCPETSVNNYLTTPRNISEERVSNLMCVYNSNIECT